MVCLSKFYWFYLVHSWIILSMSPSRNCKTYTNTYKHINMNKVIGLWLVQIYQVHSSVHLWWCVSHLLNAPEKSYKTSTQLLIKKYVSKIITLPFYRYVVSYLSTSTQNECVTGVLHGISKNFYSNHSVLSPHFCKQPLLLRFLGRNNFQRFLLKSINLRNNITVFITQHNCN